MSQEVISYYEDFSEIEKKIWDLLTNAVTDRSSEFRTPVFICGNDKDLDGRVVVLRKADQKNSFVQYHSDIRSSKIEKIQKNPNCSILFYGKQEKIQLRFKTVCKVHFNDDVTKESWDKTGHISRKCKFDNFNYTKEESEEGYKNFCVIRCKVKSIEWLYLAAKGHRRAFFDLENNKKNWLVP